MDSYQDLIYQNYFDRISRFNSANILHSMRSLARFVKISTELPESNRVKFNNILYLFDQVYCSDHTPKVLSARHNSSVFQRYWTDMDLRSCLCIGKFLHTAEWYRKPLDRGLRYDCFFPSSDYFILLLQNMESCTATSEYDKRCRDAWRPSGMNDIFEYWI